METEEHMNFALQQKPSSLLQLATSRMINHIIIKQKQS